MPHIRPLLLCLVFACTLEAQSSLPPIGLAVSNGEREWCAEFMSDSATPALAPGRSVMIVFADTALEAAVPARIRGRRSGQCESAFPQLRWESYIAYDLTLTTPAAADAAIAPIALVVASTATWARGIDGLARADLDGDGEPEEVRSCLAGEGEFLTVWSVRSGASPVRRWYEYYDWGALVDATCEPRDVAPPDRPT